RPPGRAPGPCCLTLFPSSPEVFECFSVHHVIGYRAHEMARWRVGRGRGAPAVPDMALRRWPARGAPARERCCGPASRERPARRAQSTAGGRSARSEERHGRTRGARAERSGHDWRERNLLPGCSPAARFLRRRIAHQDRRTVARIEPDRTESSMRYWLVMPGAGRGRRFGEALPKQYAELCGRTVIEWALTPFLTDSRCAGAVVVIASDDAHWSKLAERVPRIGCAIGGTHRCESVRSGLAALEGRATQADWVLVHDAARPCLAAQDLER